MPFSLSRLSQDSVPSFLMCHARIGSGVPVTVALMVTFVPFFSGDLSIFGGACADRKGLDGGGNGLVLRIGLGASSGECLHLGEGKLAAAGRLEHPDVARLEAFEVDGARASADSLDLDHVHAVDGGGAGRVKGVRERLL